MAFTLESAAPLCVCVVLEQALQLILHRAWLAVLQHGTCAQGNDGRRKWRSDGVGHGVSQDA
jgi:hypothetical protein